jgi:hypothetical protein
MAHFRSSWGPDRRWNRAVARFRSSWGPDRRWNCAVARFRWAAAYALNRVEVAAGAA